jgi:hypothetical protein
MMVGEDRPGQVIEVAAASPAMVALAGVLCVIAPALDDVTRLTVGAPDAIRPAYLPHGLIALAVINQVMNLDH